MKPIGQVWGDNVGHFHSPPQGGGGWSEKRKRKFRLFRGCVGFVYFISRVVSRVRWLNASEERITWYPPSVKLKGVYFRMSRMYTNGMGSFLNAVLRYKNDYLRSNGVSNLAHLRRVTVKLLSEIQKRLCGRSQWIPGYLVRKNFAFPRQNGVCGGRLHFRKYKTQLRDGLENKCLLTKKSTIISRKRVSFCWLSSPSQPTSAILRENVQIGETTRLVTSTTKIHRPSIWPYSVTQSTGLNT